MILIPIFKGGWPLENIGADFVHFVKKITGPDEWNQTWSRENICPFFAASDQFFLQNFASFVDFEWAKDSFVDFTELILLSKDFSAEQKCITLIDKSYDIFGRQQGNEFELFYEFVMYVPLFVIVITLDAFASLQ